MLVVKRRRSAGDETREPQRVCLRVEEVRDLGCQLIAIAELGDGLVCLAAGVPPATDPDAGR